MFSIVKKYLIAVALLMTLSLAAFADTIRLKDGSIIKGKIVSFANGKFTVLVGTGSKQRRLTYSATEIESIKFDEPAKAPQLNTAAKPPVKKPDPTPVAKEPVVQQPTTIPVSTRTPAAKVNPIEWTVRVLADNTANGWTNTGWVVKKGQRVRITATGQISLGKGLSSVASGNPSITDDNKLIKNMPTGGLVAVIGDDNNDFVFIGADREIVATRDGSLFLGINEGNIDDNSGFYSVKVQVFPLDDN
jgi:hypothetical protein